MTVIIAYEWWNIVQCHDSVRFTSVTLEALDHTPSPHSRQLPMGWEPTENLDISYGNMVFQAIIAISLIWNAN